MRLTRCYVALPLQAGARVVLPELVANHLARVLRLREGDACVLFNGDGTDHDAVIRTIGKRGVEVALVGARTGHTVWVDAPTGAWPCQVVAIDLAGVESEA